MNETTPKKEGLHKLHTTTKRLAVPITDRQLRSTAKELGETQAKIAELEAQKADFLAAHRERIKPLKSLQTICIEQISTQEIEDDVDVIVYGDFDADTIMVMRTDTREYIETRPMQPADRQMDFDDTASDAQTVADHAQNVQ